MGAVNGFRCMIIAFTFLGAVPADSCHTISGVQPGHCLVCLLTRQSYLQHSILLYRLHTNKFPQMVLTLEGRLRRARITWVQGLTLAALRAI